MTSTTDFANNMTFSIGGELAVHRMGFGAMRIVGQPGNFGQPANRQDSLEVLRAAVDSGVNFIDTAESYGPGVSEELIAEALHPYPDGIVIATKGGVAKPAPNNIYADGSPAALRRSVEASLSRLRLDRIDLYQLHRPDPEVPLVDSVQALADMQSEGLIGHIGLSNITPTQLREAQKIVRIASVQNNYGFANRDNDAFVDMTAAEGIAYLPHGPLGANPMRSGAPVADNASTALIAVADRHGVTTAQVALAWLLRRSPNLIAIPGTTNSEHAIENYAATAVELTNADLQELQ